MLYYLYDLPKFTKILLQLCQLPTKIPPPPTTPSRRRRPYPIHPPGHGLRTAAVNSPQPPIGCTPAPKSFNLIRIPPPPEGGGATNPPPPDEHNFTQSDGSPSLLTPSSLSHEGAEPTDFITVTAACGLRTTPPHDEILCPTVPSPTTTKNSFAALAPPDSPPAIPDSTIVRTADDPRPAIATTPPHHNSSSRFLASFYATWPESEVFDDSSRRIWDILHLSFAQADLVYEALDDRQSSMQTTFDARQASLQRSTKLTFDTSNPMFIVAPAKLRMPLQWRCNVSTRLMPPSSLRSRA